MNRLRFAAAEEADLIETLADRLERSPRLPVDVALSLSIELLDTLGRVHQQMKVFGGFSCGEVLVNADGSVSVTGSMRPGVDRSLDLFSVGTVLFQLFTGLTPEQARVQCRVSPLQAVPPASLFNPALDDGIDGVLAQLLSRDPAQRPDSVWRVEAALEDVCELYDLEPSSALVEVWWASGPALQIVAPPPPPAVVAPPPAPAVAVAVAKKPKHQPTIRFVDADEDSDDEFDDDDVQSKDDPGPLRFDAWAVAACAFLVAAFTLAFKV